MYILAGIPCLRCNDKGEVEKKSKEEGGGGGGHTFLWVCGYVNLECQK